MRPRNSAGAASIAAGFAAAMGSPQFPDYLGLRACAGKPASDREVELGAELPGDPGLVRAKAQLLDGDRVEAPHHLILELQPERPDHLVAELGAGGIGDRVVRGFEA